MSTTKAFAVSEENRPSFAPPSHAAHGDAGPLRYLQPGCLEATGQRQDQGCRVSTVCHVDASKSSMELYEGPDTSNMTGKKNLR
jgi:hypothetical protein